MDQSYAFTGTAQGPTALLRAVSAHLQEAGFSTYADAADGTGRRVHLGVGNDLFVNLRSAVNESFTEWASGAAFSGLLVNVSGVVDVSRPWYKQLGAPTATNGTDYRVRGVALGASATLTYWLYVEYPLDVTQPSVTLVVETAAGQVAVLGFGHIDKNAGLFTGGLFFYAENSVTNNSTYRTPLFGNGSVFVKADVDAFKGKWLSTSNGATDAASGYTGKHAAISAQGSGGRFPAFYDLLSDFTGTVDGQAVLLPARLYVQRDDGGWSTLGDLPGLVLTRRLPYPTSAARGSSFRLAHDNYTLFPGFAVRHASPPRAAGAAGAAARLSDTLLQEYRGKVLPSVQALNGGYITAPKTTTFRLWNVSQSSEVAIRAVNQPDTYGLVTTPAAPFTLLPGASRQVSTTISTDGRPFVRDKVQFFAEALGDLSPYVDASYYRALPFPLAPNGRDPVRERLTWPSTVLEAHSGKEQRTSLVSKPRRVLECVVSTAGQAETELAESLLFRGHGRLFAAPSWPDARRVEAAVPAGAMSVPLDTASGAFEGQAFAIARVSATEAHILDVAGVTPTGLVLAAPAPAALPAGTFVGPALFCRIDAEYSASVDVQDSVDYTLALTQEV